MLKIHGWILIAGLSLAGFARADGSATPPPPETHSTTQDLLIDQLERVYQNLAPSDASKVPVTLRLADLYSERARQAAMKDLDSGCTTCSAGETDRAKALRLYQEALPKMPESGRGRVLIQVGHLYELTGHQADAIAYYEKILKDPQSPASSDAELSLAEIYFKKNQYAEAARHYARVLADARAGSRGLAAYRLAWCEFNVGHIDAGLNELKQILTTRDLQSKSGVADGQADKQFVEEVSRDLATWTAKAPVGPAQIEELAKLSPDSARQANMITLGAELERTGKKPESLSVWQYVQAHAAEPQVRLEAQIHEVPLLFQVTDTAPALQALDGALSQWRDLKGCGKADCSDLQKSLRAFVVNWNQSDKKTPSENLQKAYALYLQTFPDDADMAVWATQVARARKDYVAAAGFNRMAVHEFVLAKDATKLESALLTELEIGELAQNKDLWNAAAQNYLALSPTKSKAFEVRYQLAHHIYEAGDNASARAKFKELALEPQAPRALRVQAANLALDAANQMHDEAGLSADAKLFADTLGGHEATEFAQMRYKAAMNSVAKQAEINPAGAFAALTAIDTGAASSEDKKLYLKDKMILAEKTGHFDVAAATADEYLGLKNLSAEEREFALSKKAWLSDLRLDFVTALKTTEGLKTTLAPDQKALKLAIYADLSGADSVAFYQQYLKLGHDEKLKPAIAAELVRKSKVPMSEINKNSALLGQDPELLARLYTEVYVKNPEPKLLAKILSDKRIEKTAWGRSLARAQVLAELAPMIKKIGGMHIDGKNQKTMAATIKARANELTKLEKFAQKTVESGDWTTEVVSLDALAKESDRFYQEILSLPMPDGLSDEEQGQYMNLLTQQASPYKAHADTAKAKVQELWSAPGWAEALQKSLDGAGEFRPLALSEIDALKTVADKTQLAKLDAIQVKPAAPDIKPTREALEVAREDVRQNPLDKARIEKLLNLEKQAGDLAMVHYLEGRLQREKTL